MVRALISLFIMGISFGCGPCFVSCAPLFLAYTAGSGKNITKSLIAYLLFSFSRIAVYVLLGILVHLLGSFITEGIFKSAAKYVFIAGGGFIILTGIFMAASRFYQRSVCGFLYKNLLEKGGKSMLLFGLVIGLLPCAPLFALFSYIGLISKSWFSSAAHAFSFGLGTFFSPLLLLAVFTGAVPGLLIKLKPELNRILTFVCALILIFLGAQLTMKGFNA